MTEPIKDAVFDLEAALIEERREVMRRHDEKGQGLLPLRAGGAT